MPRHQVHLNARKDANHELVTSALRGIGATVFDTYQLGDGFPDIVVGFRGVTYLIEIKDAENVLTKPELKFREDWRGSPVIIARTRNEALRAIGAIE